MKRVRAFVLAVTTALVALPATPSGAASPPPSWQKIVKTLEPRLDPASKSPCNRGSVTCVDAVLKEMKRRERAFAVKCNHNVMFSYTYRVTTEHVRSGWPRDFDSPAYIAHMDAIFAKSYFDAYDRWKDGGSGVSEAWTIALDAARSKSVSGLGDMLLGINAHISRDLPFVVEQVGLLGPDGSSALDDYNRFNQIIVETQGLALDGAARRFDPEVATVSIPGLVVGKDGLLELFSAWRAEAWARAEQLVSAATPEDRQAVVDEIEAIALARALLIQVGTAYVPFFSSTADRDEFCRDHRS
ncbi:MAG: DUF5995 family protein [Acidimicrobiia bacterium]